MADDDLAKKLSEAALIAETISASRDDIGISIAVRSYGINMHVGREADNGRIVSKAKLFTWQMIIQAVHNPLVPAINELMDAVTFASPAEEAALPKPEAKP